MVDSFLRFIASAPGRWTRIGAGTLVAAAGFSRRNVTLSFVGMCAAVTGITDVVPVAALFRRPVSGPELRSQLGLPSEAPLLVSWSDAVSAARARQGAPLH